MARIYNDGSDSTIGTQLRDFYYIKKALTDLKKEQYFLPLSSTESMPKHMGKTMKRYHYLPLLDDRNINDQGIDAAGAVIDSTKYTITLPKLAITYAVEADATAAAAAINAVSSDAAAKTGSATPWTVTTTVLTLGPTTEALSAAVLAAVPKSSALQGSGNIYGSSKDVGTITAKLPTVSETGGRVNRVGFRRFEIEGTMEKLGFFTDYTKDSLDFDTDSELATHVNREMLRGAHEITEDALQVDLLNSCDVHRFAGTATTKETISGETGAVCEVTYADLSALSIELDNNRCPKETKIISGTRMVDTRVIPAARALFIGSELIATIERMTDHFGNQAFIPVAHYAAGTKLLNGEIGTVGQFRIVVVPEMLHWAGIGATETNNDGYQTTNGKYNVYPMLVVGSESFVTIGFQTSGKNTKFTIFHKKPGFASADVHTDPYGETGFMSIKWWYGIMILRPERLALVYTVGRI